MILWVVSVVKEESAKLVRGLVFVRQRCVTGFYGGSVVGELVGQLLGKIDDKVKLQFWQLEGLFVRARL